MVGERATSSKKVQASRTSGYVSLKNVTLCNGKKLEGWHICHTVRLTELQCYDLRQCSGGKKKRKACCV